MTDASVAYVKSLIESTPMPVADCVRAVQAIENELRALGLSVLVLALPDDHYLPCDPEMCSSAHSVWMKFAKWAENRSIGLDVLGLDNPLPEDDVGYRNIAIVVKPPVKDSEFTEKWCNDHPDEWPALSAKYGRIAKTALSKHRELRCLSSSAMCFSYSSTFRTDIGPICLIIEYMGDPFLI